MKARGSAIIVAMLLISVIGGIAFAIGRLLFIESTSASYYANGAVAYYAAESGMEEGFLRYRYNRNSEVPFNGWILDDGIATYTVGEGVFRSDLSPSGTVNKGSGFIGVNKAAVAISDAMKQYYDLRMGYIGTDGSPWFGPKDTASNGLDAADFPATETEAKTTPFFVNKDDAIKIDLTGLNLTNLALIVKFYNDSQTPPVPVGKFNDLRKCRALVEAKITVDNGGATDEYKSLINYDKARCSTTTDFNIIQDQLFKGSIDIINVDSNSMFGLSDSPSFIVSKIQEVINVDNLGALPLASSKVTLFLKPLYYNVAIGLATNCTSVIANCNTKANIVSGPSTKIESTGYYGGTTRKLEADIDRQSGTLYDLFDYVIYKAN